MVQIVQTRWFGLLDLIAALTSGVILMLWPGLGYWPVLIALLPWVARLAAGCFPFKRTAFDLPLALFFGTALIGVWAAYNRETAWLKFWMLVAALLVFYALAAQLIENLATAAGLLSLLGVLLAIYFLFSFDRSFQSEDLGVIERVASFWMRIRPDLRLVALLPNVIGGILAMLLPIAFVPAALKWQARQYGQFGFSATAIVMILFGLFMTSSRGAWLALIAASGFWLVWKASEILLRQRRVSRLRVFAIAPILVIASIVLLLWLYPEGVLAAVDRLPGLPSGESRLDLARSTLYLIADYPWTGAGLASFAGIYSQYIKVIPHPFFEYGHNFYLDLAVEQGLFATLLGLVIFTGAGWYYLKSLEYGLKMTSVSLLAAAGFTSLLAVLMHGLMDDALYGMGSTPFLFLLPGLAVAVSMEPGRELIRSREPAQDIAATTFHHPRVRALSIGLLLFVLLSIFLGNRSLRASWYANLGAVQMSRVELAGWPVGKWNSNPDTSIFAPSAKLFERSLSINPENGTAHHRLGLIALQGRDFEKAQVRLEKALQLNPDHQGIRKALGYTFVWNDQPEKGAFLLSQIPEANGELWQYTLWWKQQHRQDLAIKAKDMLDRLESKQGTLLEFNTSHQ